MSVGSLGDGSILHKTGYNYGIDGASKYYNPFYVTYRGNEAEKIQKFLRYENTGFLECGISQ